MSNSPDGSVNLTLHLVNTHATTPLEEAIINIASFSSATLLDDSA